MRGSDEVFSPVPLAASSRRYAQLYSAAGGLDTGVDATLLEDGKAAELRNFHIKDGVLQSREALVKTAVEAPPGDLHARIAFDGAVYFHIGTGLYRFDGETFTPSAVSFPDAPSAFVIFDGLLYLYAATHVYTVRPGEDAKEVIPACPMYCDSVHADGSITSVRTDFKPNILAPYVTMRYIENASLGAVGFPMNMDRSRLYRLYVGDVPLTEDDYTIEPSGRFRLKQQAVDIGGKVSIRCYITTPEADKTTFTNGCTLAAAFGGGVVSGTRVILSGNPAAKGMYFVSALADPLLFLEADSNTVGNGLENVTALYEQQAYLIFFTQTRVIRMRYAYDSEHGGYFSLAPLSTDVGCICPASVAAVGDRTVFASHGGIYAVDTLTTFDRMSVVPLSQNVNGGADGYAALSDDDLSHGCAVETGDKYVFFVNGGAFVWDHGLQGYVRSSDLMKAQKQLAWFRYDGLRSGETFLFGGAVYLLSPDGEAPVLYRFGGEGEAVPFEAVYRCGETVFGSPHVKKAVTGFRTVCRIACGKAVKVEFFADGKPYHAVTRVLNPKADGNAALAVKLPRHPLTRFAFRLSAADGGVGFFETRVDYVLLKGK